MSFALSAVSQNPSQLDLTPAPKPAPKLSESAQIVQLAEQGQSNQQIASTVGLPETLVASTLGDASTTTSSLISSASALASLNARLSVQA